MDELYRETLEGLKKQGFRIVRGGKRFRIITKGNDAIQVTKTPKHVTLKYTTYTVGKK